jgi:hypothetical protein
MSGFDTDGVGDHITPELARMGLGNAQAFDADAVAERAACIQEVS